MRVVINRKVVIVCVRDEDDTNLSWGYEDRGLGGFE